MSRNIHSSLVASKKQKQHHHSCQRRIRRIPEGVTNKRHSTNSPQQSRHKWARCCTVPFPGGTETRAIVVPSRLWPPNLTIALSKPSRAFHHPMPLSYNPCPVAARLSLRRVPGPRLAPGPGLTNTDCAFHPAAAPVTHCRHLRQLHHHHHHHQRQSRQPPAVPSTTTFQLRPRSSLRPAPSTLCIAQSPLATMASATSFYDFKPVDSKLCH